MNINPADHDLLTAILSDCNDGTAVGTVALAIAHAGFIGPNETAELHQVVASLQATIASLRAAEQERLQQHTTVTQVQSSTAGAIAINRLGSTA